MAKKSKNTRELSILVANGVNLDLLGRREKDHYGAQDLVALEKAIATFAGQIAPTFNVELELTFFQSNDEAQFLEELSSQDWDGIIMNPGAWTHTSLALADRLKALSIPFIEVHLSNIAAREEFRHFSYSAPHARGVVFGMGESSYFAALTGLLAHLSQPQ